MASENVKTSNTGRVIVGGLVAILLGLNVFFLVQWMSEKNQKQELIKENEKLDTEVIDLEKDIEEYRVEIESKDLTIEDKERLIAEKDALIKEKQNKINQLLASNRLSTEKAADLQKKIDQLEYYMRKYRTEIDSLKGKVTNLTNANDSLGKQITSITDDRNRIDDERRRAELIVSAASYLKANTFKFYSVKGSGKEVMESEFKAGRLDILRTCFTVLENVAAKAGERNVYVTIFGPNGGEIKDMSGQSGYFTLDGKDQIYSVKTSIMYEKVDKDLCLDFKKPANLDFEKGKHVVRVYADGSEIGSGSFTVK